MNPTIWTGTNINNTPVFDNLEFFKEYWKSVPDKHRFQVTIEDIPKPKSPKQLRTFWGLWMAELVEKCEDLGIDSSYIFNLPHPTGTSVTKEQLKEFFYALFPTYNDKGKRITMSSRDWTTKHQNTFTESIRNYCASQFGIILSEPNPDYKTER